ncbi:hypothetical protein Tsubulata_002938 [Turnera subulata]|uniref:Apyrase n=1 Tax=Turnera subulata TaxID=218843 RepID=A0A9Q0FYS1_9ROSI|nr:hypothetical protein Tsubulata_002938 [Turnera subulata]
MEPKSPSKLKLSVSGFSRCKRVLKLCSCFTLVLLLLSGVYFAFRPTTARDYYTVVVDCGSTGTRVNVYKWETRGLSLRDLPVLLQSYPDNSSVGVLSKNSSCKYHCMQTEPGLDEFIGNATGVRVSLEPLILLAERWVPRERHKETPIFVLATAGLRRLQIEDARRVLDDVEEVVREHSFVYRRSWIRVLSGKEEAYYGWVALNYKMGSLGNSSRGPTLGLLDLGGSSLQVVMEVDGGIRDDEHFIRSKIGSVEHWILAYSLPSFGLNEAFDRTIGMLNENQHVRGSSDGFKLKHPCLASDYVQNYTCHSCNMLDITNGKNFNGEMHQREHTHTYLVGDPDWERCKRAAKAAAMNSSSLDLSQPTVSSNCGTSLSGRGILNLTAGMHHTGRFHALSGFFVVYNKLNLTSRANLTKVWQKAQQLCSKSWAELSSTFGNQSYIGQYCFRVPYMASLIEDALCLGDEEIIFGPGDLSWTLGAALVEGNYLWLLPIGTSSTLSMKTVEVIHFPIFVFILLLSLSLVVYYCQIKLPMLGKKVPAAGLALPSYVYQKRSPN